jgi:hypothetical protein
MGDEHTAALMAAFAVAMNARSGQLTAHMVDDMRTKAEEVLRRDHPAYPLITAFATQYELHNHDRTVLATLGETLERGIRLAVAPAPARLPFRSDIDG